MAFFFPVEVYFAYNVLVLGVEHGDEIRARIGTKGIGPH